MKDNRSIQIKRLLRQHYPDAKVRVKIQKYSLGESIHVYTDLMPQRPWTANYNDPEMQEYKIKWQSVKDELEKLLKDFSHVDRDDFGNILGGGNIYLFIEPLK